MDGADHLNPADVPPGVVAFLLSDCRYSPEVVSRCLVELEAEGVVRLDPLVSLTGSEPRSGRNLLPYEKIVTLRIGERGRQAPVPLPVLLGDDGDDYQRWRKRLTTALRAQVKNEGLARATAGRAAWWIGLPVIVGTLAATLVGYQVKASTGATLLGVEIYASLAVFVVPLARRRWRPTKAGAEVAAWWRQRVGLDASEQAPVPLPPGYAWSPAGGHWHPVKIGPEPKLPRPGTRRSRLMRLPDSATVTGPVVKLWTVEVSECPNAYLCSVDDGQSPTACTFDVGRDKYLELRIGDTVQITFSPRQGRLIEVERLGSLTA